MLVEEAARRSRDHTLGACDDAKLVKGAADADDQVDVL